MRILISMGEGASLLKPMPVFFFISDTVNGKRIGSKILRQVPGAAAATNYTMRSFEERKYHSLQSVRNGMDDNYFGSLSQILQFPLISI